MKCKFLFNTSIALVIIVLIEAYWNVNYISQVKTVCTREVLIEAYWNVNELEKHKNNTGNNVLIEAYWNVNISGDCEEKSNT